MATRMTGEEEDDIGTGIYVSELGVSDVLLGRGTGPYEHEGNAKFRKVVSDLHPSYMATKKRTVKQNLLRAAVNNIKDNGRFLTKVSKWKIRKLKLDKSAVYEVVKDSIACEKTKQAVRYLHYKADLTIPLERHKTTSRPSMPCQETQTGSRTRQTTEASLTVDSITTVESPPFAHSTPALPPSKRGLQATMDGSTKHSPLSPVRQASQHGPTIVFPPHLNVLEPLNDSGYSAAGGGFFQRAYDPQHAVPHGFKSSLHGHPDEIPFPRPINMNPLLMNGQGLDDSSSMIRMDMPVPLPWHPKTIEEGGPWSPWMANPWGPTRTFLSATTAIPYSATTTPTPGVPTTTVNTESQCLPSTGTSSAFIWPCPFSLLEGPWIRPPPADEVQGSQPSPSSPHNKNNVVASQVPAEDWFPPSAQSLPEGLAGLVEPFFTRGYPSFVHGMGGGDTVVEEEGGGGASTDLSLGIDSMSENDDSDEEEKEEGPSFEGPDSLLESQQTLYRMQMKRQMQLFAAATAATAAAAAVAATTSSKTTTTMTDTGGPVHHMSCRVQLPPSAAVFEPWLPERLSLPHPSTPLPLTITLNQPSYHHHDSDGSSSSSSSTSEQRHEGRSTPSIAMSPSAAAARGG